MSKIILIDSHYDETTGISTVGIEYKGKRYNAYSTLAEEDKQFASNLTGCRYAYEKAVIKALKAERLEALKKCEEIRKFVKALQNYKNFDSESPTAKAVYRQLNRRIKEVDNLTIVINKKIFGLHQDFAKQNIVNNGIKGRE